MMDQKEMDVRPMFWSLNTEVLTRRSSIRYDGGGLNIQIRCRHTLAL